MKIGFSKNFIKKSKKLSAKQRQQLLEQITVFKHNPLDPRLRNHQLVGKFKHYRSIDITGDIRVLYLQTKDEVIFDTVGTHSQLYG